MMSDFKGGRRVKQNQTKGVGKYSLMQKIGYTFAIVYSSKCVSVFLHQTLHYQKSDILLFWDSWHFFVCFTKLLFFCLFYKIVLKNQAHVLAVKSCRVPKCMMHKIFCSRRSIQVYIYWILHNWFLWFDFGKAFYCSCK